ncbi:bifunctional folylpolyglutamate synthase/dihydrofolate synthase [Bradyrhizobium jicamae]|uniref:bifunctional folylpolyglutamate synthase/dihydrofolate synthase n=1 Tax=Bradyrhizobium jicamae TaxID=280332 RepID=UPI001BA8809E|nr:cyanophycin synthetase [Bradyrhizobium jicamae]MBR0753114.1 bifunctional folylpolyglutamate synthase/dihydrofolate synthase [Bradyrhizobium jicamae]
MIELPKFGKGICLARVDRLLTALGIDRARLAARSIVVTGSNGKGSTSVFCEFIARSHGLTTGLFTSPHLFAFSERFRLNGIPVDQDRLANAIERVSAAIKSDREQGFGAFEAQFAVACLLFMEQACDLMIFEAGIGGRYDPVRTVGSKVTAVVSVDLEHTELLGNSLELIALDKTDACASGGTVIYGQNCLPLHDVIESYVANRGVSTRFVGRELLSHDIRYSPRAQTFDLGIGKLRFGVSTRLLGSFQINNAVVAAALVHQWLLNQGRLIEAEFINAVRDGLLAAHWPGRLETISDDPHIVIDVGHTPDGITQTIQSLDQLYPSRDWIAVVGVSRDKDVSKIIRLIARRFDKFVCARAYHKGSDPQVIAESILQENPKAAILFQGDVADAMRKTIEIARRESRAVVVIGGLFLAAEFAVAYRGGDPKALRFF